MRYFAYFFTILFGVFFSVQAMASGYCNSRPAQEYQRCMANAAQMAQATMDRYYRLAIESSQMSAADKNQLRQDQQHFLNNLRCTSYECQERAFLDRRNAIVLYTNRHTKK